MHAGWIRYMLFWEDASPHLVPATGLQQLPRAVRECITCTSCKMLTGDHEAAALTCSADVGCTGNRGR